MTALDQLRQKMLLKQLAHFSDGLSAETLRAATEQILGRPWGTVDCQLLLDGLVERKLLLSWASPLTDEVYYGLTDLGKIAAAGGAR